MSSVTATAGLPSTPQSLLPIVLRAMQDTPNPRVRVLVQSLVRHLHAFVLETQLTEREFEIYKLVDVGDLVILTKGVMSGVQGGTNSMQILRALPADSATG